MTPCTPNVAQRKQAAIGLLLLLSSLTCSSCAEKIPFEPPAYWATVYGQVLDGSGSPVQRFRVIFQDLAAGCAPSYPAADTTEFTDARGQYRKVVIGVGTGECNRFIFESLAVPGVRPDTIVLALPWKRSWPGDSVRHDVLLKKAGP